MSALPTRPTKSMRDFVGAPALTCALFGAGAASLILPAAPLAQRWSGSTLGTAMPALVVAFATTIVGVRLRRHGASWLGGAAVAGTAWLLSQARPGAIDWLLAAVLGMGVSLARPGPVDFRNRAGLASAASWRPAWSCSRQQAAPRPRRRGARCVAWRLPSRRSRAAGPNLHRRSIADRSQPSVAS